MRAAQQARVDRKTARRRRIRRAALWIPVVRDERFWSVSLATPTKYPGRLFWPSCGRATTTYCRRSSMPTGLEPVHDLRKMLLVSECVARAAPQRTESRGGHT